MTYLKLIATAGTASMALAAILGASGSQATPPADGVAVALNFANPGLLTELLVTTGQQVRKGQALAHEDPTLAQNAIASAQANVDAAKSALAALTAPKSAQEQAQQQQAVSQGVAAVAAATQALADAQAQAAQDAARQSLQVTIGQQALSDTQAAATQEATTDARIVADARTQLAA
ncbi:MAG: hypothetical protein QOC73_759, partial [Actinomycetota bacterium]|nr:hypothetical protein [Actinomycetota bacterium]